MSFVHRFWHNFRLGLLVIMFIATSFYLLVMTPWAKYFGPTPNYSAVIQQGQPIVDAIYHFKQERGLWPEYLDDLTPAFLPKPPPPVWYYTMTPDGPSLAVSPRHNANYVGFNFDPKTPAWRANEDGVWRTVKILSPPPPATLPHATVIANELAELDRRIIADHGAMQHYRAKAALLRSLGRLAETRAVIARAQQSDENNFWPRLATVALDLQAASTQSATASSPVTPPGTAPAASPATAPALPSSFTTFESWVRANLTFTNLYYLALAYRMAGRDAQALVVMDQAASLPPVTAGDDMEKAAFYLWDMARFALKKKDDKLVLKLTASWKKMQMDGRAEENSYLPLGAAVKLTAGRFADAQADLDKLTARHTPTWAQHVSDLQSAISRRDQSFTYDPGDFPPPYQVFKLPQ